METLTFLAVLYNLAYLADPGHSPTEEQLNNWYYQIDKHLYLLEHVYLDELQTISHEQSKSLTRSFSLIIDLSYQYPCQNNIRRWQRIIQLANIAVMSLQD